MAKSDKPSKPRSLTYTEMMNGGRQKMSATEHQRELDLETRINYLEQATDHLEKSWQS